MRIDFIDPKGAEVRVVRTQYFRANNPNVTAYYAEASAGFGGRLPKDKIHWEASVGKRNRLILNRVHIPPTQGDTKLEIEHIFTEGMPFGIGNVLIPEFILRYLLSKNIQPSFIVRRGLTTVYLDEHILDDTYFQLTAERYIHRNVTIDIVFNRERLPKDLKEVGNRLEGQMLRRGGIESVYSEAKYDYHHQFYFKRLCNEKVRIPFKF